MAILRYYEEIKLNRKKIINEPLNQLTIESYWNNHSDEKSSEFYIKRYLNAKKKHKKLKNKQHKKTPLQ